METFVDSLHFQQVMTACRTNDKTTAFTIVEERLAAAAGAERAFWLRVRARQRARDAVLPQLFDLAWADLEEALTVEPDDLEGKLETLENAFRISLTGERADRMVQVLRAMRPHGPQLQRMPFFWQALGCLNMKRGRWHKAVRAWDRAIAAFDCFTVHQQEIYACRFAHYHGWRAICLAACRDLDRAAADVDLAHSLAERQPPQNINHAVLGMAKAELALESGRLQEARTALQQGIMQDTLLRRPKAEPAHLAERELLAARIARAEGNEIGFAAFCDKALTFCSQYSLPLTEGRVRAVMAGAPR